MTIRKNKPARKRKPKSVTLKGWVWQSLTGNHFEIGLGRLESKRLRKLVPSPNDDKLCTITVTLVEDK